MNNNYLEKFKEELTLFKETTEKFYNKEIDVKTYKGFSGKYGSYAQRGGNASMLRLRMSGGRITKEKLKFVIDSIDKYNIDTVHFTTCQTVQLHNLTSSTVCSLINEAFDNDIITIGGGGDFPRNVMVSPLSGVEEGENFDVMPYAEATANYLLTLVNKVKLPRKLKVCFSNSPKNVTHATFRDLGFVSNSNYTFDVYSAGGLGNNPKMGICVAKEISPSDILYYIKAMVLTFTEHGNYDNRAKARTRYMQDVLGTENYIKEFRKNLETAKSDDNLKINIEKREITKTGMPENIENDNIIKQKQHGLYAFKYHPIGGTPSVEKLKELYKTIKDMEDVELRLSPNESLYIINCTSHEIEKISSVLDDGAKNLFETSVACIGNTICQIGLRNSQGLLKTLVETTREHNFKNGTLPRIHISGCTSSCGTHQIGTIGFHGSSKVIDKVAQPAFFLHMNGNDIQGKERFGERLGVMLEKDIPNFITDLGKTVEAENKTFEEWFKNNESSFIKIAEKYLIS